MTVIVIREKEIERLRVGMFIEVRDLLDADSRRVFVKKVLDTVAHAVQNNEDLRKDLEALGGEMFGFAQDADEYPRP